MYSVPWIERQQRAEVAIPWWWPLPYALVFPALMIVSGQLGSNRFVEGFDGKLMPVIVGALASVLTSMLHTRHLERSGDFKWWLAVLWPLPAALSSVYILATLGGHRTKFECNQNMLLEPSLSANLQHALATGAISGLLLALVHIRLIWPRPHQYGWLLLSTLLGWTIGWLIIGLWIADPLRLEPPWFYTLACGLQ